LKKLKPKPSSNRPPSGRSRLWPYALLAALAIGVYYNALGNNFISDDNYQLLGNPWVTDWRQIPQIFQNSVWAYQGPTISNYYRPIQALLYMALYYTFGFDAFVFHLFMILIHAANTMLVYRLGQRLLKSAHSALAAAILFAVHPIHSEAVDWIAVLPDVLLTLLTLIAIGLFIRWDARPAPKQIATLCALFFLALLTKEPGAMLIPLLMGYEFLFLGRSLLELWKNRALYLSMLGVFGIYCLMRIHALGGMAPSQGNYFNLHGITLLLSVIVLLGQYLAKLVLPIHLNYYYLFTPTTSLTLKAMLSLLAEAAVVAGIFLFRGRAPAVSYGLFAVLIPLAPALNINGVGENVFTERYLYLPSIGALIAAAVAWQWLADRQQQAAWGAIAVLAVASAWILIPRNRDWHDDVRLFSVTNQQSPNSASVIGNLAGYYYQRGEFDQAIEQYRAALKLKPKEIMFHNSLGSALAQQGHPQEAIVELRKTIELRPDYAEAHKNLGLALETVGDIDGAVREQHEALRYKPNYAEPLTALALIHMRNQDYFGAVDLLKRAIAANPLYAEAYINLGVCYNDTGRYAEGATALRKALEVAPEHPSAYVTHYNLGISYENLNSIEAAAYEFSQSLQLRPDYADARNELNRLRLRMTPAPVPAPRK
jgi:Flp pilus assembly protein TadD